MNRHSSLHSVASCRLSTVGALGLAALLLAGCSKKDDAPAAAASASAVTQAAPPPTAKVVHYVFDKDGKTHVDGPAPVEHLKADTTASSGTLDVDLMNLANSRGEVKVDLTTLTTHTFDSAEQDTKQTKDAAGWLEVGDAVKPEEREANRWAVYAIQSVDGLSATDVSKVAPVKEGGDDVRTVTLTTHGDFLLHGHKVDKAATVDVKFHYPAGAPADSRPTSIEVVSKAPLKVTIAEHDVKPRDNFGKIASRAFGLLGTKVAQVLDITLELRAKPQ